MVLKKKTKELVLISNQNQISIAEAKNYKSIGMAIGLDIRHCIYLANQHTKNFRQRVLVWRLVKDNKQVKIFSAETGDQYMAVEFYEKKKSKNF